ncbi:hypothetical protein BAE44_0016978 [Dichanthelium oligosanthes]|uniref:Uncharacterized protein n=1 Tax=Dichanthelium oligosanthes TaxID=888268 RepID=A0A1E5VA24_9POAL|nr:hypothetical protein BAE44_0016978 [Dichanthelium oligosanthes]
MMGALAWQATVIKKYSCVPGEEIARGLILFWPRVLLPHGVPVPVHFRSALLLVSFASDLCSSSIAAPHQNMDLQPNSPRYNRLI